MQTMKGLKLEKDLLPDDVYFQYTTVSFNQRVHSLESRTDVLVLFRNLDWMDDVDHDAFWDRLRGSDHTLRRIAVLP